MMGHIHNNLMELVGSLDEVSQKFEEKKIMQILENGLTIRNKSSFNDKLFPSFV
jgi:hypothetical protein